MSASSSTLSFIVFEDELPLPDDRDEVAEILKLIDGRTNAVIAQMTVEDNADIAESGSTIDQWFGGADLEKRARAWVMLHYGICIVAAAEEEAKSAAREGRSKAIREALEKRKLLLAAAVSGTAGVSAVGMVAAGGGGGSGTAGFAFKDADGKFLVLPRAADAVHAPASTVFRRLADEERGQEFLVDHVKLVVSDVMTKLRGKAFDSISETTGASSTWSQETKDLRKMADLLSSKVLSDDKVLSMFIGVKPPEGLVRFEVADCSKRGAERNLIQNLKDFQSIATPLFGKHVEGMFKQFIEKLEDAAQEMGITDDYKRWLIETAYAKLVQYCMGTKEAVLTTGDSIREDRSGGRWIALKWTQLIQHAIDMMTYEECKRYTEQIKPHELASLVVTASKKSSSKSTRGLDEDEDDADDNSALGSKKKKVKSAKQKKVTATPAAAGAPTGQNGVALQKIGTPNKQRLCMEELAAQLDVLQNGQATKCQTGQGCRFEHVVKGQPKAWVADQVATCHAVHMKSGGVPSAFATALAAAVTADAKKLFK